MGNKLIRWWAVLLISLLAIGICSAEEIGLQQTKKSQVFEILLIADDGFQSVGTEDGIPFAEVLDTYIAALESQGIMVRVQGSTNNNYPSTLRYRTEDQTEGGKINWSDIPRRGNAATFSSTIGSLSKEGYDDYDKLIIISGRVNSLTRNAKRVRTSVPSWLIQLEPLPGGNDLVTEYARITGLNPEEQSGMNVNGYKTYSVHPDSEQMETLPFYYRNYETYQSEELLEHLLMETLFDGSFRSKDGKIGMPGKLTDQMLLFVRGNDFSDLQMISPDGTIYSLENSEPHGSQGTIQKKCSFGDDQIVMLTLQNELREGIWKISPVNKVKEAKVYYTLKDNYQEMIENIPVIKDDFDVRSLPKGTAVFSLSDDPLTQDLFKLYPDIKIKVTDTIGDELVGEAISNDENPEKVEINLPRGGTHRLTFRMMNHEKEILKQTQEIVVEDKPLEFILQDGEQVVILFDTYQDQTWRKNVKEWFTDPDGDEIDIRLVGGGDRKISIQDNILSFTAGENEVDSSENVRLQARADTSDIYGSFRLVWRSLKREMEELLFTCEIVPTDEEKGLVKYAQARMIASVTISGEDEEIILDQLGACNAKIIDEDGNYVAPVKFNRSEKKFESDTFELPAKSGIYTWRLMLTSAEDSLPQWELKPRSAEVKIENHLPVAKPELLSGQSGEDSALGEQYLYEPSAWKLDLPLNMLNSIL